MASNYSSSNSAEFTNPEAPPNPSSKFLNLSDPSNPYRLENGDNPALTLVIDHLTIENYTTWSRAAHRALRAKNKFVNRSLIRPTEPDDPLLNIWDRCNDMVVSWLQNSISPSVKLSIALVDSASEIWLELRDRFTQQNGRRIFQLKQTLATLQQDQASVSIYFGKLKTLWDELSVYDPLAECTCGKLKIMLDRYQKDCIIQFLMGLNDTYSNVRDQIMLLDPLPPVNKIFSLIQQQERQHRMLSELPSTDSMALLTRKPYSNYRPSIKVATQQKQNRPYCTHCKVTGHVLENCFKAGNANPPVCTHCNMLGYMANKCYRLHGYPPGHKFHTA